MADDNIVECNVVALVEIKFKTQRSSCSAMVFPGDSKVLFTAVPLKDMPARLPYYKLSDRAETY